jgi:hypothetical protein
MAPLWLVRIAEVTAVLTCWLALGFLGGKVFRARGSPLADLDPVAPGAQPIARDADADAHRKSSFCLGSEVQLRTQMSSSSRLNVLLGGSPQ